eukprot:PhF_6_TR29185/c1_g2_i2/m.42695
MLCLLFLLGMIHALFAEDAVGVRMSPEEASALISFQDNFIVPYCRFPKFFFNQTNNNNNIEITALRLCSGMAPYGWVHCNDDKTHVTEIRLHACPSDDVPLDHMMIATTKEWTWQSLLPFRYLENIYPPPYDPDTSSTMALMDMTGFDPIHFPHLKLSNLAALRIGIQRRNSGGMDATYTTLDVSPIEFYVVLSLYITAMWG